MGTTMNPGQHARLNKEAHPELYCPKCLWKTGGGYCPRHDPEIIRAAVAKAQASGPES